MYPSDKMHKSCVALSNEDVKKLRFNESDINTYVGPLEVLPSNVNGATRRQNLLERFDKAIGNITKKASMDAERRLWKGQSYIPRQVTPNNYKSARAPIVAGTSLTKGATAKAGAAMAVGIVLDAARAAILYDDMIRSLNKFSKITHMKHPESIGAVFTVSIIYLKVDRPYGRVPMFGGVYLAKLVNPVDDFYASDFVNKAINDICKPKFQTTQEKLERFNINNLDHPSLYESAILFVKCNW